MTFSDQKGSGFRVKEKNFKYFKEDVRIFITRRARSYKGLGSFTKNIKCIYSKDTFYL